MVSAPFGTTNKHGYPQIESGRIGMTSAYEYYWHQESLAWQTEVFNFNLIYLSWSNWPMRERRYEY